MIAGLGWYAWIEATLNLPNLERCRLVGLDRLFDAIPLVVM